MKQMNVDMSQNFFAFSIFYFFYNANILKNLKRSKFKIISLKFVDDINILTYETNTTNNCKTLKNIHKICNLWTRWHDVHFASTKYELLHLIKNDKHFDMTTNIRINKIVKTLSSFIRVFELQIDSKLKWNSHLKFIQNKINIQTLTLFKFTSFTWKTCFVKTRHVYNAMIWLIITFDFVIWHLFYKRFDDFKRKNKQLNNIQKSVYAWLTNFFEQFHN